MWGALNWAPRTITWAAHSMVPGRRLRSFSSGHQRVGRLWPNPSQMEELKPIPEGVEYQIAYERRRLSAIGRRCGADLAGAVMLVAIVVLVFLQNCGPPHPLVAVPVAIIGTFAFMAALGFSLEQRVPVRTGFSDRIVVDDAIVVVRERRTLARAGAAARERARQAMDE